MDPDNNPPIPSKVAGVLTTDGQVYRVSGELRELPAKRPYEHRWCAVASWYLSPEQAEAGHIPGNRVLMEASNLSTFGVVCWDCELTYLEVHDQPCQAGGQ